MVLSRSDLSLDDYLQQFYSVPILFATFSYFLTPIISIHTTFYVLIIPKNLMTEIFVFFPLIIILIFISFWVTFSQIIFIFLHDRVRHSYTFKWQIEPFYFFITNQTNIFIVFVLAEYNLFILSDLSFPTLVFSFIPLPSILSLKSAHAIFASFILSFVVFFISPIFYLLKTLWFKTI